jgi:hypothetical protein
MFAKLDSKFLHFYEYEGLSLHLQKPLIRSYREPVRARWHTNYKHVSKITFSSTVTAMSNFPKEYLSLRNRKQILYAHLILQ